MRTTIEARNRRATIHALDELRTDKGKQLSIKLTVLYLLCAPTTGLNDSRLIGYWWTDASQWNWTKTINWKELKPFFSSQAFMALSQSIRQDRSQLRKIRESAHL